MLSLTLGPFSLAINHLILLLALVVATWVGARTARANGQQNPENALFVLVLWALLVARVGFVLAYWEQYRANPWQWLDIRDGGLSLWPGLAALGLGAGWQGWRRPGQRKALAMAMVSGLALWLLATGAVRLHDSGQSLPDLTFHDARGAPLSLRAYQGQPLVINLWATWCPPCRREMPVLLEAAKDSTHVRFVLLNQGEDPESVQAFLTATGMDGQFVLYDPASAMSLAVGSSALPVTLFYDAQGRLVRSHVGELSRASLAHALQSLEPASGPPG